MKKERILVCGGTGYIGSHTVVELLQQDYDVVIIDNLSNSYNWITDNISTITGKSAEFHQIDLRDIIALEHFFDKNDDISGVIHFAAFKSVGESVEKPNLYYHNNLISLINLTDCMIKKGIINFIFSSSCTVYGEPDHIPINENAPLKQASSPYGNTKKISEDILFDNSLVNQLKVITLRYFNPVGAHSSGLIGELPVQKPQSLMPVITQTCIGKQEKMNVHGNDYPTRDGTAIRDYFHVSDLALAHIKAYDYLKKRNEERYFEIFNLGSEKGYSVLEVINAFEKHNNIKVNHEIGPRRAGDIVQIYADSSKAKEKLGWTTGKTLKDMVESAWKWELYLQKEKYFSHD